MLVIAHDACVEAILEEVAAPVVALVEALRVAEVQQMHTAREVLELGRHDQVKVVGHLAGGEEMPVPALRSEPLEGRKTEAIGVVAVNRVPCNPARRHVVDASLGEYTAGQARHRANVSALHPAAQSAVWAAPKTNRSRGQSPGQVLKRHCRQRRIGHVSGTVPETCAEGPCLGDSPLDMARMDGGVRARRPSSRRRRRGGRAFLVATRRPSRNPGRPTCSG
jgi:hypothetical protein